MKREYIRVTLTSEELQTEAAAPVLASLHKLTTGETPSLLQKLNPLKSTAPLRFEFLILSEGKDAPVEFYYGADDHLDTLEKRLRSIYPATFNITRAEIDPATKLIPPTRYEHEEFVEALDIGELLYDFSEDEQVESDSVDDPEHDSSAKDTSMKPAAPTDKDRETDAETMIETEAGTVEIDSQEVLSEDDVATSISRPTQTDDGKIWARKAINCLEPVVVQWCGVATRKDDWMTMIDHPASTRSGSTNASTGPPLATLIDELSDAAYSIGFQALFERRSGWVSDAELRKENLRDARDTWSQRWIGSLIEGDAIDRDDRELDETVQKRIDQISTKDPKRTFTVNLRAIAVPPNEDAEAKLDSKMESLRSVFDSLDGRFYGIEGQRLHQAGWRQATKTKNARTALRHILEREVRTGSGKTRSDLVLNAGELANFVLAPSAEQLTVEGSRGTRAEHQSRNPLPRPHPDLMREFRTGLALGYALDEDGEPENTPVYIPPRLLPVHYAIHGRTGAGKSIQVNNGTLSLHENTSGPTIMLDRKGDGMAKNYMRAHARRFGMTDLEENVIHFEVPELLPGFSFFNLTPSLANGHRRRDAIQRLYEYFREMMILVMGEDKYESTVTSGTLIKALIGSLLDEEHGRENGRHRESADYFAYRQLEDMVDQVAAAGPPNPDLEKAPKSSNEVDTRRIRRQVDRDTKTAKKVLSGVSSRLAYISDNNHLHQIFNNTEARFDFRDMLDEDKVIIFDLGDLSEESAHLLTGLILSNLQEALKEQKQDVNDFSDDYVVNLFIDEAASLVVSDLLNDLLEKGRSFRLSVGLAMQFPEQIEAEGGRKMYLNVLNNVGSSLVGNVNVDRELARAMAHEEMDPEDFANRVGSLPRGEWIANLPSPTFGETGPYPFSVKPLPIPAGHPESEFPLSDQEEERFQETLSAMHQRIRDEYCVPEEENLSTEQLPEAIQEALATTNQDLDQALAKTIRIVQLRDGVRDENGWVTVEDVDAELRSYFDDLDADPPEYDVLADIRERSRLLEVDLDAADDTLLVRLTDAGESAAAPETGDTRAAGSEAHDAALHEIEAALTPLGFRVTILRQDGNELPDARATHPDLEETFAIEVETTTPENPVKVLTNLRKAQDSGQITLFVVRPGETETYWAERVEQILTPPVLQLANGETRFYTHDEHLTFNSGATEDGGVTAVRPKTGENDTNRTVWVRDENGLVLRDGEGTDYLRLSSFEEVSKDRVPATYSYDQAADEYVVYEQGEQHVYDTKAEFEADWVRIKKPFVPDNELPVPEYQRSTYAIVILRDDGEPLVYEDGVTKPLSALVEGTLHSTARGAEHERPTDRPDVQTVQTDGEESTEKAERSLSSFVEEYLIEDGETALPKDEVYTVYTDWASEHDVEPVNKSWFSRKLSDHIEFETGRNRRDGELVRCYIGFCFAPHQETDSET
ncbi:helicase HerA domain-containing protein [Haloarcula marina]|uniref:helicase HerA domain-containing protein n=1 Tax=Haloarcula marina TaxID=2961574 RepID=UPI0020B76A55|nr:DUF87 domain-containing protein [Halomicroarcula marina]